MSERPLPVAAHSIPRFVPPWRWWAGFCVIVTIVILMSAVAYVDGLPPIFYVSQHFDKFVHFTSAGLLAFFLDGALGRRVLFVAGGVALPVAAAAVLVPAAMEEYLQRYATLRTSSIWDFAADVAGVMAFIPLSRRAAR